MPERRAAVESETGNAEDGELHCYDIARFAARVIGRCLVDGGHFTVRKGGGLGVRRFKCILVEPETDRVFRFHLLGLLVAVKQDTSQVCTLCDRTCWREHALPRAAELIKSDHELISTKQIGGYCRRSGSWDCHGSRSRASW